MELFSLHGSCFVFPSQFLLEASDSDHASKFRVEGVSRFRERRCNQEDRNARFVPSIFLYEMLCRLFLGIEENEPHSKDFFVDTSGMPTQ